MLDDLKQVVCIIYPQNDVMTWQLSTPLSNSDKTSYTLVFPPKNLKLFAKSCSISKNQTQATDWHWEKAGTISLVAAMTFLVVHFVLISKL